MKDAIVKKEFIVFPESMIPKKTSMSLYCLLLAIGILKSTGYYLIAALLNEIEKVFESESESIIALRYWPKSNPQFSLNFMHFSQNPLHYSPGETIF